MDNCIFKEDENSLKDTKINKSKILSSKDKSELIKSMEEVWI